MDADISLVEKVKAGDLVAFSELVMKHQKSLLRLAFRVVGDLQTAQDVVQESFMKAYQKIGSFEGRSQFKSWVYQITLNTAKNKIRGKKTETIDIENVSLESDDNAADLMENESLRLLINEEVQKLPAKQRLALSLRIFDDLSFTEIADIMDCPYDTAKANYRHALMKLRHTLSGSAKLQDWIPHDKKLISGVDA
jgi:RNA polymerase sigma-70 factor (ECF subfamily)